MRLFDIVREFSGQKNTVVIQRSYIRLMNGNYNHAAVLSQLIFWSGKTSRRDGQFYKSHKELAAELDLTKEQVRHAIDCIKKRLPSVIETQLLKANGAPTLHYRIDSELLMRELFPEHFESESDSESTDYELELTDDSDMGKFPNPICENSQIDGYGKIPKSLTDPTTDLRSNTHKGSVKNSPTVGNILITQRVPQMSSGLSTAHVMHMDWLPTDDFAMQARLIGLTETDFTAEELNEFRIYWTAEGRSFHHMQWMSKFAIWLREGRKRRGAYGSRSESAKPRGNVSAGQSAFHRGRDSIQQVMRENGFADSAAALGPLSDCGQPRITDVFNTLAVDADTPRDTGGGTDVCGRDSASYDAGPSNCGSD